MQSVRYLGELHTLPTKKIRDTQSPCERKTKQFDFLLWKNVTGPVVTM